MRDTLVLPIKKIYFEAIRRGDKTIEYRDIKPFYTNRFSKYEYKYLRLSYYQAPFLIVEIKKIEIRDTPVEFLGSEFLRSDKCYWIHLGKVIQCT